MTHPLLQNRILKLKACHISGNSYKVQEYRNQLPILSSMQEQQAREAIIIQNGKSFQAGMINKRLIYIESKYIKGGRNSLFFAVKDE